jgi:antitoxin component YwqK of YwqJK toxin-antitoxin module
LVERVTPTATTTYRRQGTIEYDEIWDMGVIVSRKRYWKNGVLIEALGDSIRRKYNEKGIIVESIKDGIRERYHSDGSLESTCRWNGKLHGTYSRFYENGELEMTVEFVDGSKQGLQKAFYPDGEKKSVCEFNYNHIISRSSWYKGGRIEEADGKRYYENGRLKNDGVNEWHENGAPSLVKKDNTVTKYFANGKLESQTESGDCTYESRWYWDNGNRREVATSKWYWTERKGEMVKKTDEFTTRWYSDGTLEFESERNMTKSVHIEKTYRNGILIKMVDRIKNINERVINAN